MSDTDETLDPEDWDELRRLGHRMIDDMIDHLRTVRERPAWQPVPAEVRRALEAEPVPRTGMALEQVYESFRTNVLPYPTGNLHPGFFGWVMGNGTVTGMLADLLASGMNPHLAGYDQSAAVVERQVIGWIAELMGFPADSSGILVSGGTMANLNGLAVARHEKVPFDLREHGLQAAGAPRLTVYGSVETHSWINKACELMGLGRSAFRRILTDDAYRIDVAECRRRIIDDLEAGAFPFAIIGTVGTVNTGAVDDIAALRALADEFGLWLHVDGAFGALAALAPAAHHLSPRNPQPTRSGWICTSGATCPSRSPASLYATRPRKRARSVRPPPISRPPTAGSRTTSPTSPIVVCSCPAAFAR